MNFIKIFKKAISSIPFFVLCVLLGYAGYSLWEIKQLPLEQITSEDVTFLDRKKYIWGTPGILGTSATAIAGFVVYLNFRVGDSNRKIAENKQVSERFIKAVELLGEKDKISMRIGAIYALEQVAIDFPSEYKQVVVNLLSAFVRETSHFVNEPATISQHSDIARLPTDLQAAIDIISKLVKKYPQDTSQLSLEEAYLDFTKSRLKHVWLNRRTLKNFRCWYSDLSHGYFEHSKLPEANFWGANLTKANFRNTDLSKSKLGGAEFTETKLEEADLRGSNLKDATFKKAKLKDTKLKGAILLNADFSECDTLEREHIEGENAAFLCATKLPEHLSDVNKNRDCYDPEFLEVLQKRMSSLKNKDISETRKYIDKILEQD